jgi:hypothetical protein
VKPALYQSDNTASEHGFTQNLENLNFFDHKLLGTCEKGVTSRHSSNAGIIDVMITKSGREVLTTLIAVIPNTNVPKVRASFAIAPDCAIPALSLQRKNSRRDVVRIVQCEEETFQTIISHVTIVLLPVPSVPHKRLPLRWTESAEEISVRIQN